MDTMFRDEKNLKDPQKDTFSVPVPYQANGFGLLSYKKTNKLVMALYMVTDILDKDEPLRNKLRTLGTEIVSDITIAPTQALPKITAILSLLDIASTVGLISQMNSSILQKEFTELDRSIKVITGRTNTNNTTINLEEFLKGSDTQSDSSLSNKKGITLGVQKGRTLMQVLSSKIAPVQETNREQRREDILKIIRVNKNGATIKDIKDNIKNMSDRNNSLVSLGEKTLQRELIAMVKIGVLYKTGEKRWSRYFVK